MSDWPSSPVPPLVTVVPWSIESIGTAAQTIGNTIGNSTGSFTWWSNNLAVFFPFWVYTPTTFVQGFCYNGSTASGNVDVGIYDDTGTRIVSMGSTAQSGTSTIQKFNITDTTLGPGRYFMALALSSTVGTISGSSAITTPQQKLLGFYEAASSFALPATVTFATPATALRIPFFGFTTNTVL